jgi:hypothetical protein
MFFIFLTLFEHFGIFNNKWKVARMFIREDYYYPEAIEEGVS